MTLTGNHCSGKFSRQYQIMDEKMIDLRRHVIRDQVLLNRYNKISADRMSKMLSRQHLTELQIQHGKLIKDMTYFDVDLHKAKTSLKELGLTEEDDRYSRIMWVAESIKQGQHFFTTDNYGRLHTNFTILKKVIRNGCITHSGQAIDEVDITNSQPLFLTVLMRQEGVDIKYANFVSDVRSGKIYETLQKYSGLTRKKSKELCFQVLYGANTSSPQNRVFRNVYPDVWQWIKSWKHGQGQYQALARKLQQMESQWVYETLMPKLRQVLPYTPFFTVHDSVYFPSDRRKTVVSVFNQCLSDLLRFGI